jgi:two-component system NtrC family sensor kinase
VTAELELDRVLSAVVDAAVTLTRAEEGSILLLDEDSGDLTMRAARNFKDEFVRTFRVKANDSLAGQVLESGEPLFIDSENPLKLDTEYLVQALIYVPISVHGRTIGVLGVDNRQSTRPFEGRHAVLLTALADYAAVAIENARLFGEMEVERGKLERIVTHITDGVVVIDPEDRLAQINPAARKALGVGEQDVTGRPIEEVIRDRTVLQVLRGESQNTSEVDIQGADERVYDLRLTAIEGIGAVLTLHDISYLKEIDRLKSDFVNTVSHDLRSPLTAILGYVELVGRVGPVNDQQQEFIQRAVASVKNITELITDLLHLGRVELGLDEFEPVPLLPILRETLEGFQPLAHEKSQALHLDVLGSLPVVEGNPVRLRQVLDNLVGNAIKYTPAGGKVGLHAEVQGGQVILRVIDSGVGIPPEEQARVFDRFYRASNVPKETPGTGLGLAITKQIVENHGGRIWVESSGGGTTFTVVLPVLEMEKATSAR